MPAVVAETHVPRQLSLGLFTAHELNAWEHSQGAAAKASHRSSRRRLRPRPPADSRTAWLFELPDLLLADPLAGPPEGNELNCVVDPLCLEQAAADGADTTPAAIESWSDQAVAQLHEAVLHYSLKALQARGNAAEKREILQWIFAPEPRTLVMRGARGVPTEAVLPAVLTPFSFERCCRYCGLCPERLSDALLPVLLERGLGNVFNEIANGRFDPQPDAEAEELRHP